MDYVVVYMCVMIAYACVCFDSMQECDAKLKGMCVCLTVCVLCMHGRRFVKLHVRLL